MTNTNILEGMACPQCGSEGPFKIWAESSFTVYDDGTDDHGDVEWRDDSSCECGECDHSGTVKDYTIGKKEAAP
jgi:Zn ribbon nucleic-acid-binding protein